MQHNSKETNQRSEILYVDDMRLTSTQCIILGRRNVSEVGVMGVTGVLTELEARRKRITKLVGL